MKQNRATTRTTPKKIKVRIMVSVIIPIAVCKEKSICDIGVTQKSRIMIFSEINVLPEFCSNLSGSLFIFSFLCKLECGKAGADTAPAPLLSALSSGAATLLVL
jgi:hypothetical protein